jgi:hypothetical protein
MVGARERATTILTSPSESRRHRPPSCQSMSGCRCPSSSPRSATWTCVGCCRGRWRRVRGQHSRGTRGRQGEGSRGGECGWDLVGGAKVRKTWVVWPKRWRKRERGRGQAGWTRRARARGGGGLGARRCTAARPWERASRAAAAVGGDTLRRAATRLSEWMGLLLLLLARARRRF